MLTFAATHLQCRLFLVKVDSDTVLSFFRDHGAKNSGGGVWKYINSTTSNLNDEPLTAPKAVEAINDFSNNTPDNVCFE